MKPGEEVLEVRKSHRTSRMVPAVLAALLLIVGATVVLARHHEHGTTHRMAQTPNVGGTGVRACGRELDRLPQTGPGPLDGGLVVTSARIPPIIAPSFESVAAARGWLPGDAPVVVVRVGSDVRAYPLAILQWHEVIDDVVGSVPVAVTYCPLCNTAVVYSRVVAGRVIILKASGALLLGSAVLADSDSRNLWSQVTGQPYANLGRIAPAALRWMPSDTLSLDGAAAAYSSVRVLARPSGSRADYASSPYGHVADGHSLPQLYVGWVDEHLAPKARLVGVALRNVARAWRYDGLRAARVRNDIVGRTNVVVVYRPHVSNIGDASDLRHAPQTGSGAVFASRVGSRVLHFDRRAADAMRDRETGTVWDLSGRAVHGPLAGRRLSVLPFLNAYWFAWVAFHPQTSVWPPIPRGTCAR